MGCRNETSLSATEVPSSSEEDSRESGEEGGKAWSDSTCSLRVLVLSTPRTRGVGQPSLALHGGGPFPVSLPKGGQGSSPLHLGGSRRPSVSTSTLRRGVPRSLRARGRLLVSTTSFPQVVGGRGKSLVSIAPHPHKGFSGLPSCEGGVRCQQCLSLSSGGQCQCCLPPSPWGGSIVVMGGRSLCPAPLSQTLVGEVRATMGSVCLLPWGEEVVITVCLLDVWSPCW